MLIFGIVFSVISIEQKNTYKSIVEGLVYVKQDSTTTKEDWERKYINNCITARPVYQWGYYQKFATRVGNVNLKKHYPMTLDEYLEFVQHTWDLNRELCIPYDDWKNYIQIGKYIIESALYDQVEHTTGEVIALTGYTPATVWDVYGIYKNEIRPIRGSAFYIAGLYDSNPDFESIFKDIRNVTKFDYMYCRWLLDRYGNNWDFTVSAHNLGINKPDYWQSLGMKKIPRKGYKGLSKWENFFLRNYYLAVYEVAQCIASGNLQRPSRMNAVVSAYRKVNQYRSAYIGELRLKIKHDDRTKELEKDIQQILEDVEIYKKETESMIKKSSDLAGLQLDFKYYNRQKIKSKLRTAKNEMQNLWWKFNKRISLNTNVKVIK